MLGLKVIQIRQWKDPSTEIFVKSKLLVIVIKKWFHYILLAYFLTRVLPGSTEPTKHLHYIWKTNMAAWLYYENKTLQNIFGQISWGRRNQLSWE